MTESLTFQTLDEKLGGHAPFLISLSDGLEEALRLTIAAAAVGEAGGRMPDLEEFDESTRDALCGIPAGAQPIEPDEARSYEICFHDYIVYQIRNESYSSWDPEEIRRGRYLILFEQSKLLSCLKEITIAQKCGDGSYYPGEWKHYGIYTQTHIIDVISHEAPEISGPILQPPPEPKA